MRKPLSIIYSLAPIRICDNGGWTDTWFAGHGQIFNIAVLPCAEVRIDVFAPDKRKDEIIINARNFGQRYAFVSGKHWDKQPLLEATLEFMRLPSGLKLEISIFSAAPAGASVGTSAAITVALIGALDLLTPGRMSPHAVAEAAHQVETEMLGLQSGIQDQFCSAYGGINYIEMFQYPRAKITPVKLPTATWKELERRLSLIYLGKAHHSSEVHDLVIRSLQDAGEDCKQLEDLRSTATRARDALLAGDFIALGASLSDNTAAQTRLHPALVSPDATRVIEIAKACGAIGWKVNGAGGLGGSLTILSNDDQQAKREMLTAIERDNSHFKNVPISISQSGLRTWQSDEVSKKTNVK